MTHPSRLTVEVHEPEPVCPPVRVIIRHPKNSAWYLSEAEAFELYDTLGKVLAERTRPEG